MIWHSCYHAWTFEVWDLKIYPSKNKFLPLHAPSSIPTHIQERREREQQDLELAKEMAEEDEEEDFP